MKETYSVPVFCKNCTYGHTTKRYLHIEKGEPSGYQVANTECPVCGCCQLEKQL